VDINLTCAVNNLSYGLVGSNICHALTVAGHRVSLFPVNPHNIEAHPKLHKSIKASLKNAEMPNFYAPSVLIWHQHDMTKFVGKGQHIGFPIFELDTFTEQELHHLHSCDRLFVCSKWAKDVIDYAANEREPSPLCKVVPLGVDNEIFYPAKSYRKSTIFLNCGKWEVRKGHDLLPEIFNRAFTPEDDVELWMMASNIFNTEEENKEWEDKYTKTPMGGKIKFIPHQETQSQIADIMRQADCGVFPYRAEGWCMPLLEMMACGKEVIGTNYSGPTEFLPTEFGIDITGDMVEAVDGKWFNGQGKWARVGNGFIDNFAREMKSIHTLKKANGSVINQTNVEIGRDFSWANTATKLVEAIK
jgi:glycosyltransferase involved in cell wall biosynthesis